MSRLFKLRSDDKGQGVVEFALVLPILIALILGMIEFGWALNGKITLNSAVREGARVAAVYNDQGDLQTKVADAVRKATINSGLFVHTTNPLIKNDEHGLPDIVEVEATANFKPIIGLYLKDGIEMKSKAVMKKE